jgi:hypothetical protein
VEPKSGKTGGKRQSHQVKRTYTKRSETVAWPPPEATAEGKWEGEIIEKWFPLCVFSP